MVAGGKHPQGKTSINVTPLGGGTPHSPAAYDAVAKAFYFANTQCLTPSSTFEGIRFCLVEAYKPDLPGDSANIANAWAAVGVLRPPTAELYTVPITNMELSAGSIKHYYMDVPTGQTVACSADCTSGNADLYVRFGSEAVPDPAFTGNACSSTSVTSMESCSTAAVTGPTRVFAAVHAYSTFSSLTFQCTLSQIYTRSITSMALSGGSIRHYHMDVSTGQTVSCLTSGPNGNADLYVRFGSASVPDPAFPGNACSSTSEESMESCSTTAVTGPTRVYATVYAYSTFSGLNFQCTRTLISNPTTTTQPTTSTPSAKPTSPNPSSAPAGQPTSAPSSSPTNHQTTGTPKPTTHKPTRNSRPKPTIKPTTQKPTTTSTSTLKPSTHNPTSMPTTAMPRTKPTTTRKPTAKASKQKSIF
jgi:hypothetical protein